MLGYVLGLVMSFNVIREMQRDWSAAYLGFAVPRLMLAVVFGIAHGMSLLSTLLPARLASAVYPAEALRYEETAEDGPSRPGVRRRHARRAFSQGFHPPGPRRGDSSSVTA